MIKLEPLESFILNICAFLCGVILFYNFSLRWLFLSGVLIFIKKVRVISFFFVLGLFAVFIRLLSVEHASFNNMEHGELEAKIEKLYFKKGALRALISPKDKSYKLIASFTGIPPLKIGDEVVLKGLFLTLPSKVYPNFYDVEVKSRFSGIIGYFKVQSYEVIKSNFSLIQKARERAMQVISTFKDKERAGVAVALLLGDKGMISKQNYDTFKKAGLAHILAISGLHMTIVFFFTFVFAFQVLSFTSLCLYVETKKLAGFIGISLALFYLILAGTPISGIRSFLMTLCMFLTFFLRGSTGIRSLGVSLFIILMIWPEEGVFPSLQLSFTSVLCLLNCIKLKQNTISNKVISAALSSFFTTLATIPFALHHFGFVHFYGAISNVFAIPLLAFVIMPLAVLSFAVPYIFGWLFEASLAVLFKIAEITANLPFTSIFMPYFNGYLLSCYTIGLIFALCFNNKKIKLAGVLIILLSCIFYLLIAKKPYMIVNSKYAVLRDGKNYVSLFYIPDGFLKTVWEEKVNAKFIPIKLARLSSLDCRDGACFSFAHSFTVIYGEDVSVLNSCTGGILVNLVSNKKDFNCNFKKAITLKDLENKGEEPFVL